MAMTSTSIDLLKKNSFFPSDIKEFLIKHQAPSLLSKLQKASQSQKPRINNNP